MLVERLKAQFTEAQIDIKEAFVVCTRLGRSSPQSHSITICSRSFCVMYIRQSTMGARGAQQGLPLGGWRRSLIRTGTGRWTSTSSGRRSLSAYIRFGPPETVSGAQAIYCVQNIRYTKYFLGPG